jgi:hypothetical protein
MQEELAAKITSGCRLTNSFATMLVRSTPLLAQRTSIRELWPWVQLNSPRPCVNLESWYSATGSPSSNPKATPISHKGGIKELLSQGFQ